MLVTNGLLPILMQKRVAFAAEVLKMRSSSARSGQQHVVKQLNARPHALADPLTGNGSLLCSTCRQQGWRARNSK